MEKEHGKTLFNQILHIVTNNNNKSYYIIADKINDDLQLVIICKYYHNKPQYLLHCICDRKYYLYKRDSIIKSFFNEIA